MTTMEETQALENQILEHLNGQCQAVPFLQTVLELLSEAVDSLVLHVFSKDDYAVKYAVEPLLSSSGPLAELPVRLKLLYALGAISRDEYEDITLLCSLCDQLSHTRHCYQFTDPGILVPLTRLHNFNPQWLPSPFALSEAMADTSLVAMQQQRYQQVIHSALVLYFTELITRLRKKQAF